MKSKLQNMSDCLKDINENIDALFNVATAMEQDANELEATGFDLSTERLSAHNISCVAIAFDTKLRTARDALKELAEALGHEINTEFN